MSFIQDLRFNLSGLRLAKHISPALLLLFLFSFYFTYNLYTGKVYFSHNDFPGMYYPFRQWFLSRLLNFEFPLWNPYWGAGHEAVIWSTVPVDPYTILELVIGARYAFFHLIQCMAIVLIGYYVFRKFNFESWASAIGSLIFFMSPIVTYWFFEFINTNTFIAHMLTFLFMVKWFESGRFQYLFLTGWAFFFGMFGTKLEFWFFEAVFFAILPVIIYFIIKPARASMVFMAWAAIITAILAQSWQINLLLNALSNSGRLAIPHGLHNLFSAEMYRNLYLSIGDSDLIPAILIGVMFFAALHSNSRYYRWLFFLSGISLLVIFKFWNFSFLHTFIISPVLFGALFASIMSLNASSKRHILSAWILFMLPAYYWCKPLVNSDELYLLPIAPVLFKAVWGFFVWLGCLQVHRFRVAQVAYLSILIVFLLQAQGQVILSYLFGFLWMPARDNYLLDFSFAVIAAFGTIAYFQFKPILLKLAPFVIIFASYTNLYYMAPLKPVPGYANPLLNYKLSYDPFTGVPALKEILKKIAYLPYRRTMDTDIENRLPQNQGTFLLERTANATFYGSMVPARYRELINFYRYNITPEDNVSGYPSVYSEKIISRLPKLNSKGFSNGLIYYSTVWITPPSEPNLLKLLGVSYFITRDENLLTSLKEKLNLQNSIKSDEFNIAELSDILPRSFLVLNVNQGNLQNFQENMRPHIKLKDKDTLVIPDTYIAKPAQFLKYEPEHVSIQVESETGGYLVLTDVFHPYWSASVDGSVAEIIPAFHAFRAVKVPAGSHKVDFFCSVPYLNLAFLLTFILSVVCLITTFYFWNKKLETKTYENINYSCRVR